LIECVDGGMLLICLYCDVYLSGDVYSECVYVDIMDSKYHIIIIKVIRQNTRNDVENTENQGLVTNQKTNINGSIVFQSIRTLFHELLFTNIIQIDLALVETKEKEERKDIAIYSIQN